MSQQVVQSEITDSCDPSSNISSCTSLLLTSCHLNNDIFSEVRDIAKQQLDYALQDVGSGAWELFVNDGELKMYKMEKEICGIVVDPLKATHSVKGVSAREYIDLFFSPDIKLEWDDTLDKVVTVKILSPHTVILHQVHKRIWPANRREALFWSQRLNVSASKEVDSHDAWMVCNHDTSAIDVPLSDNSCIRVRLTITMLCQTIIHDQAKGKPVNELTRDDISCKIIYVAEVHPGGWVPQMGLRQVYKREYPKFLRQFTKYVQNKVNTNPLYT